VDAVMNVTKEESHPPPRLIAPNRHLSVAAYANCRAYLPSGLPTFFFFF